MLLTPLAQLPLANHPTTIATAIITTRRTITVTSVIHHCRHCCCFCRHHCCCCRHHNFHYHWWPPSQTNTYFLVFLSIMIEIRSLTLVYLVSLSNLLNIFLGFESVRQYILSRVGPHMYISDKNNRQLQIKL